MSRVSALASLMVVLLAGTAIGQDKRVNNPRALIVRGMNQTYCDAASIGAGSSPQVGTNTDVQNLSVNCSPDGSMTVPELRTGLPNPHVCWTKLEDLEDRNADVIVSTNPIAGNPNHCLVRDITPNQMIKALHYRQ